MPTYRCVCIEKCFAYVRQHAKRKEEELDHVLVIDFGKLSCERKGNTDHTSSHTISCDPRSRCKNSTGHLQTHFNEQFKLTTALGAGNQLFQRGDTAKQFE